MSQTGEIVRIGMVGLGVMGGPVARHLAAAGYSVVAYARKHAQVARLQGAGVSAAGSLADLAKQTSLIITVLPDEEDVQDVLLGLEDSLNAGSVFVDMGTHSPTSARHFQALLREWDCAFADAPVSGGEEAARSGTLSVMVGASTRTYRRIRPILRCIGRVTRMGPVGAGQAAKACNQLVVGMTIEAVAEAFTLATKSGLSLPRLRRVLNRGYARSRVLQVHGERMIQRRFEPGARTVLHAKDAEIVIRLAEDLGVDVPSFRVVESRFRALVESGHGNLDHSALILLFDNGEPAEPSVAEAHHVTAK